MRNRARKIQAVRALRDGAQTPGERAAADAALERLEALGPDPGPEPLRSWTGHDLDEMLKRYNLEMERPLDEAMRLAAKAIAEQIDRDMIGVNRRPRGEWVTTKDKDKDKDPAP